MENRIVYPLNWTVSFLSYKTLEKRNKNIQFSNYLYPNLHTGMFPRVARIFHRYKTILLHGSIMTNGNNGPRILQWRREQLNRRTAEFT